MKSEKPDDEHKEEEAETDLAYTYQCVRLER